MTQSGPKAESGDSAAPGVAAANPAAQASDQDRLRRLQRLRRWGLAIADASAIGIGVLFVDQWSRLNGGETIWALVAIPIWIVVA